MKEYQEWSEKAKKDFAAAQYNIKGNHLDAVLFLLQQSVEKALKAVYIKTHGRIIKIHDLLVLSREVHAPQEIQSACKIITPLYYQTRYPDSSNEDLYSAINTFLAAAKEVIK